MMKPSLDHMGFPSKKLLSIFARLHHQNIFIPQLRQSLFSQVDIIGLVPTSFMTEILGRDTQSLT